METVAGAASRDRLVAGLTLPAPMVNEIAHELFNQMTVINLCSGRVAALLRGAGDSALTTDLEMLKRAAEAATRLAERLAQLLGEPKRPIKRPLAESSPAQPLPS
jgi:hypothetical protein